VSFVAPVRIAPVVVPTIRPAVSPYGAAPPPAAEASNPSGDVTEIAARRTPMSMGGIRQAIAGAYRRSTGGNVAPKTLDILAAHVAHETARGDRMFNHNFGGIKGAGPSGLSARYQTTEVLGGQTKKLVDGFRAYRNAEEGASDYLKLLNDRFPGALREAKSGDVSGFAASLKQSGYFTADLDGYTRALQAHVHSSVGGGRSLGAHALVSQPAARHDLNGQRPEFFGQGLLGDAPHAVYARELALESQRIDGRAGGSLPTSVEVARVIGAMNTLSSRIGAPIDDHTLRPSSRTENNG